MHNIEHRSYMENINRDWVQRELDHYVAVADYQEGCTGLGRTIRWLDSLPVYPDYAAAEKAIDANDKGWYDCLAVRYYEPERSYHSDKLEQLQKKYRDLLDAYHEKNSVWAKELKAEYVSCRKCGSKLKREYIRTNACPLCRADLRSESTLKAVEAAKQRYEKARKTCDEYLAKHAKKNVKWLVKIEYHT